MRDADCATIFQTGDAVADSYFLSGRNEPANQHLHHTIAEMTARPEGTR